LPVNFRRFLVLSTYFSKPPFCLFSNPGIWDLERPVWLPPFKYFIWNCAYS